MSYVYYYVYAPITGTVTGRPSGYCDGGSHPTHNSDWDSPYDLAGSGSIKFIGSPNIGSIKITVQNNSLCSGYPAPWSTGVKVDFYSGAGNSGYIGSTYYGHVAQPTGAVGIPLNTNNWTLGAVPTTCPDTPCDPNDGCFTGPHSHFEKYKSDISSYYSRSCYSTAYQGSTRMYRWAVLL